MERRTDLERGLREMLDDIPPHDDRARRATLEALPSTRQRKHRWLPGASGGARVAIGPAYVGVAAAGLALIAGLGLLLMADVQRPAEGPGGITTDLRPPARFEGTILCGPELSRPTTTITDIELGDTATYITEDRGAAYALAIESIEDPRLEGSLTNQLDTDRYGIRSDKLQLGSLRWTIENDDGAWTTSFSSFLTEPNEWSTATARWAGSGGYEGLVALMQIDYIPAITGSDCGWHVHGLIVPAELLPTEMRPEPALRPREPDDSIGP